MDYRSEPLLHNSMIPNSATRQALQVQELLLHIFSFVLSPADLSHLASVCSDFTPVARSILYGDIDIVWRLTRAQPLLLAFELNSSLTSLVKSLRVTGFSDRDICDKLQKTFFQSEGLEPERMSSSDESGEDVDSCREQRLRSVLRRSLLG